MLALDAQGGFCGAFDFGTFIPQNILTHQKYFWVTQRLWSLLQLRLQGSPFPQASPKPKCAGWRLVGRWGAGWVWVCDT